MEGVHGGVLWRLSMEVSRGDARNQWDHARAGRVRLDELVAKTPCHVTDIYIPDRNKLNMDL